LAQARSYYERALALDPRNIEVLIGMALSDASIAAWFMTDDRVSRLAMAETAVMRVLSFAPDHAMAHYLLGTVQISSNRAAQGIAECELALSLDRNLAAAHGHIGLAKYFTGQSEETEAHIQNAIRLSPRDTNAYLWMLFAGLAKFSLGYDEGALARFSRAIGINRNYPLAYFHLGATLALLRRPDEAQAAAVAGLALDPTFTIRRYRAGVSSDNPTYLALRERVYEGMRQAGLPEG
jgi:tetratricopeptide (TPR) repeat protein